MPFPLRAAALAWLALAPATVAASGGPYFPPPGTWVEYASTPTPQNPEYGVMNWFLNRDRTLLPSAPPEAVVHLGNGTNAVYVDPVNELVVVVRWIRRDQLDAFIGKVLGALAR